MAQKVRENTDLQVLKDLRFLVTKSANLHKEEDKIRLKMQGKINLLPYDKYTELVDELQQNYCSGFNNEDCYAENWVDDIEMISDCIDEAKKEIEENK